MNRSAWRWVRRKRRPGFTSLLINGSLHAHWISLQKCDHAARQLHADQRAHIIDWMDEIDDFASTAALMASSLAYSRNSKKLVPVAHCGNCRSTLTPQRLPRVRRTRTRRPSLARSSHCRRDRERDFVPHDHRVTLRVALRDDGQQLARARLRQFECKTHNAFDAGARHDRHVGRRLDRMTLMHAATDARISRRADGNSPRPSRDSRI
jgi:hypothetical protein